MRDKIGQRRTLRVWRLVVYAALHTPPYKQANIIGIGIQTREYIDKGWASGVVKRWKPFWFTRVVGSWSDNVIPERKMKTMELTPGVIGR
jgi:hypothetical protein